MTKFLLDEERGMIIIMDNILKNEDLDICRECGGMCCKKSGCDYWVSDFQDLSYKGILKILSSGNVSIVATLDFITIHGSLVTEPLLYLRARNSDKDVIDLVSYKTRCSLLTDTGCSIPYEQRPSGGKNLKPSREEDGPCQPILNPINQLLEWKKYQTALRKVVKNYTGMSVENKIRQDVEILFRDLASNKLNNLATAERMDLRTFLPLLMRAYPDEYRRGISKGNSKVFTK